MCIALAAIAIVGASLAYFTDTKTATNTFTMGNVQIKLDETDVKKSRATVLPATPMTFIPVLL